MEFIDKNLQDIIAFVIFLRCLFALILKKDQSDGLAHTLTAITTSCMGFLLRGQIRE